jgi:hypothetical protein
LDRLAANSRATFLSIKRRKNNCDFDFEILSRDKKLFPKTKGSKGTKREIKELNKTKKGGQIATATISLEKLYLESSELAD